MEHPILFSGEMVRAILSGTKTQTRRVVWNQPSHALHYGKPLRDWPLSGLDSFEDGVATFCEQSDVDDAHEWDVRCPYGVADMTGPQLRARVLHLEGALAALLIEVGNELDGGTGPLHREFLRSCYAHGCRVMKETRT